MYHTWGKMNQPPPFFDRENHFERKYGQISESRGVDPVE